MPQVLASLRINPENPDAVNTYFEAAIPLIEAVGGKVIEQIDLGEQLIGKTGSSFVFVVEYPDRDAIDRVFSSAQYKSIIPVRDKAFSHYNISIIEMRELPEFA